MPKKHRSPALQRTRRPFMPIALCIGGILLLGAFVSRLPVGESATSMEPTPFVPDFDASQAALGDAIAQKKVLNAHEHIQGENNVPDLMKLMDAVGMSKTVLVGSSWFTITMNDSVGFTRYDENNEAILNIAKEHPDHFEAWPTINPLDPQKFEKIVDFHQRGATGIKLYTGHGYTRRDNGDYMFHPIAMDDPSMFPLYEYWEEHHIPICFHVNPYKPGFAQELIEVLRTFPDMKVIAPHFILSSIRDSRMREFLDTFPNLYSDISFGHDDFLTTGLARISRNPQKFRDIFTQYPDRFFFGSDLVLTELDRKSHEWMVHRIEAYYDMLTKEEYSSPVFTALSPEKLEELGIQGGTLRGLGLPRELLEGVLYRNFEQFIAKKPRGTRITRSIDWSRMGVEELDRYPGQSFPPEPKS